MREEWAAKAAADQAAKVEAAEREAEAAAVRAAEEELLRAARQGEEAFMNKYRAKWQTDDLTIRRMEVEMARGGGDEDGEGDSAARFHAVATNRPALRLPALMPKSASAPLLANLSASKPYRSKRGGVMLPPTEISVRLAARHSNQ